jgi:hypothetical protein
MSNTTDDTSSPQYIFFKDKFDNNLSLKNMYCGDDVSSVVFDIGSFQVRSGYSGEDVPRCVVPSMVGVINES